MIRKLSLARQIPPAARVAAAIGILLFINGGQSSQGAPQATTDEESTELRKLQEKLQEKRNAYEQQLRWMPIQKLAQRMETDSINGLEPFNSAAYREAISRGKTAGSELRSLIIRGNRSSLIGLLALRKVSPEEYSLLEPKFRVNVLKDALENSKYFNTWGIPNLYWEDAAKAIIDEKQGAVEALRSLLNDTRDARLFGSEGAALFQQNHYKVKDYAWALLQEIPQ
jgi:hypothetical protein